MARINAVRTAARNALNAVTHAAQCADPGARDAALADAGLAAESLLAAIAAAKSEPELPLGPGDADAALDTSRS